MNIQERNAINFLLFAYFGITLEKNSVGDDLKEDDVLRAAIGRAYQDAASHVLSLSDLEKNIIHSYDYPNNEKALSGFVLTQVKKLFGENTTDFDTWHNDCCAFIANARDNFDYKDDSRTLSYGIGQKWVNMTLKYLYLLAGIYSHHAPGSGFTMKYAQRITDLSTLFHAPIDGYILQGIYDAGKTKSVSKSGDTYKVKMDKATYAWSKIPNQAVYSNIENLIPGTKIEWECEKWIEVAQARNKKEEERKNGKK